MNRTQILGLLADRQQEIATHYGVKRLALNALREELRPYVEKEMIHVA